MQRQGPEEGENSWEAPLTQPKQVSAESTAKAQETAAALPIAHVRGDLVDAVRRNSVTIVVGETGSGKSTQLPQYLLDANYKNIVVTQPRRIAAISVAERVCEERGCKPGGEVGYRVRFEECVSQQTNLTYVTDGFLLQQQCADRKGGLRRSNSSGRPDGKGLFSNYDVVILDEIHERTVSMDILIALLKTHVDYLRDTRNPRYFSFKVIVMSATMNGIQFKKFFNDAPIHSIPGRSYPVSIRYTTCSVMNYIQAAVTTVNDIARNFMDLIPHLNNSDPGFNKGHILVFLTGEEEIELACKETRRFARELNLNVLPMYSHLPVSELQRVFHPAPSGTRNVIFATNIAETSITIDNVTAVVDCGFHKHKAYLPRSGVETLLVTPISKASAQQRAGRAGRTGPGMCFRLYPRDVFESLPAASCPEVLASDLSQTVLQLAQLGFARDIFNFPFVDQPDDERLLRSVDVLHKLHALDVDSGSITSIGSQMSRLPLPPQLAASLLHAKDLGCVWQIGAVVSMLSVPHVFYRRKKDEEDQSGRRSRANRMNPSAYILESTRHRDGDHMTLLKTFEHYCRALTGSWGTDLETVMFRRIGQNSKDARRFCTEQCIHERHMKQAGNVFMQLCGRLQQMNIEVSRLQYDGYDCPDYSATVRQALCGGLFLNAAALVGHEYVVVSTKKKFGLHHSTSLRGGATWLIYGEQSVARTSSLRSVCRVEPEWIFTLTKGSSLHQTAKELYAEQERRVKELAEWNG